MTMKKILAAAVIASVALTTVNAADELKGRGASFPGPVYKAWTSEYYKATSAQVNYTPTGSGDGI
ncbi:MAG: substrate-binding domain-containing protein, partial [Campylobacterota bacterium]|nr:substrate-binding domain-containing protein [Campylobacterota bacterium]